MLSKYDLLKQLFLKNGSREKLKKFLSIHDHNFDPLEILRAFQCKHVSFVNLRSNKHQYLEIEITK